MTVDYRQSRSVLSTIDYWSERNPRHGIVPGACSFCAAFSICMAISIFSGVSASFNTFGSHSKLKNLRLE